MQMEYIIVGLGNPGEKYAHTRHNAGRIMLDVFREEHGFSSWREDRTHGCLVSGGALGGENVTLVLPERFMNRSGSSVKAFVKSRKEADRLIVVYDDLDLGFGTCRVSFGRGSGGHRGVESIIESLGTKDFTRVRIGVAPFSLFGKVKKPRGEARVLKFLMSDFTKKEQAAFPRIAQKVVTIIESIILRGRKAAMNEHN